MYWRSSIISNSRKLPYGGRLGFGLVELMVSISIMTIISAIILARHDTFNSAVLLRGQAYEVALDLRNTQLSAVSAVGEANIFRRVYGIYFNTANDHFDVFIDSDDDRIYDADELYQSIKLDERFEIRDIKADGVSRGDVTIIFERPNFDAIFFDSFGTSVVAGLIELDVARRGVAGGGPAVLRTVEVTATGQISVI